MKIIGDKQESKEWYKTSMKPYIVPRKAYQLKQMEWDVLEAEEQDIKEVPLNLEDPDAKVLLGFSILEEIEQDL